MPCAMSCVPWWELWGYYDRSVGNAFRGRVVWTDFHVVTLFSPRFFGHSMNNLKDIPFAVGYLVAIFYFVRMFDRYPVVKLRHDRGHAGNRFGTGDRFL